MRVPHHRNGRTGWGLAPPSSHLNGADGLAGGHPADALRILMVVDSLDIGGAERHVVGLASALVRDGHRATIACSVGGALAPAAKEAGVRVLPLLPALVKRRLSLAYAWRLFDLVRREHFDLVHAHVFASEVAAWLATGPDQVPLVLTEHTEADWRSRGSLWLSRGAYRSARRIIAVSSGIRRQLIGRDNVPPDRVSMIPNALPDLPVTYDEVGPLLRENGHSGPLVGVIARLQREKGVAHFLEAAARVAHEMPEARFVVIGDGPLRRDLELLSRRLGLADRVRFLGLRPDAPILVASLDLLAVPSLSEGTALRILEAMAAGVPVVASAVGGIPDQISDGRDGVLVPAGDSEALAAAILELLQHPERARLLGVAGRRRLADQFNYQAMLRSTIAVYRAVLRRPRPRPLSLSDRTALAVSRAIPPTSIPASAMSGAKRCQPG